MKRNDHILLESTVIYRCILFTLIPIMIRDYYGLAILKPEPFCLEKQNSLGILKVYPRVSTEIYIPKIRPVFEGG